MSDLDLYIQGHSNSELCCSQGKVRNYMNRKLLFTTQEHLTLDPESFQKYVTLKAFFKIKLHFPFFMMCGIHEVTH